MSGFIKRIPFGQIHRFNDQRHAQNFVKYMFSQSKGHPEVQRTKLNLITETRENGEIIAQYDNETPARSCAHFLKFSLPSHDAKEVLVDDGAYIAFLLPIAGVGMVSNFLTKTDGQMRTVGPDNLMRHLRRVLKPAQFKEMQTAVKITNLDDVTLDVHREIDRRVHAHIIETWPGRTLLLASHHDQRIAPDNWHTNPFYHVHRLRMREKNE